MIVSLFLPCCSNGGRRLNSAAEDDYFPSFLTAAPSAPSSKADKKENSPLSMNRARAGDASWSSKGKPRLTFAESLSMEKKSKTDVLLEDSPFNLLAGADGSYLDRMHVRRRKPHSATDDDNDFDDDVPPPPTVRLAGSERCDGNPQLSHSLTRLLLLVHGAGSRRCQRLVAS